MKSAAVLLMMALCGVVLTVIEKEQSQQDHVTVCKMTDVEIGARLLESGEYQPEVRATGVDSDMVLDITRSNAVDIAVMFHDEFGRFKNGNGDAISVSTGDPEDDPIIVVVPEGANGLNIIQITSDESKHLARCVIDANKKFNK